MGHSIARHRSSAASMLTWFRLSCIEATYTLVLDMSTTSPTWTAVAIQHRRPWCLETSGITRVATSTAVSTETCMPHSMPQDPVGFQPGSEKQRRRL